MLSKRNVIVRLSYLVVLVLLSLPVAADAQQQLPTTAPAALAAGTQPAGQQPAIAVDAAEHDFGQLRTGEKVEHRFKITNSDAYFNSEEARSTKCESGHSNARWPSVAACNVGGKPGVVSR